MASEQEAWAKISRKRTEEALGRLAASLPNGEFLLTMSLAGLFDAAAKAVRERDEAIARAEAAERERDEARADLERLRMDIRLDELWQEHAELLSDGEDDLDEYDLELLSQIEAEIDRLKAGGAVVVEGGQTNGE